MNLQELKKTPLGNHKRKRVGRGPRSGHGKTSCRGNKGAGARSGFGGMGGHEGGQTPLFRRLPKRGFSNVEFHIQYSVVNVGDLNRFPAGSEITPELLVEKGIVGKLRDGLKVLGSGAIDVPLKVSAHKFSPSAAQKIREAGGEIKEL